MRISVLALAAGALLTAAAGPAHADPKFLESYGSIFAARPSLTSPGDERPKDAVQGQDSKTEDPARRLLVSPFLWNSDDVTTYGIGFQYASVHQPRHPWSIGFAYYNSEFDGGGSTDTVDLNARFVLWQPAQSTLPVVSLVGRYQDYDDLGERADVLLAADQQLTRELFATANLGWADHIDGAGSDFVAGFGATWRPARYRKLSVSADYVLDNDVDGEDFWTISALWALDRTSSVRVGGGKHGTLLFNYLAKWDMK
ncbi:MAG: hypothetical protein K0Q72_2078 [Armatimonadetes bacterium]|jgi:hypothetical protein|nr:hypothetical protein [Armatimonadota bacterium]